MYQSRVNVEILYMKREKYRKGLIQQELTSETNTIGSKKFLDTKTDWMRQLVNAHEKEKKKNPISKESNKLAKQLGLTPKKNKVTKAIKT